MTTFRLTTTTSFALIAISSFLLTGSIAHAQYMDVIPPDQIAKYENKIKLTEEDARSKAIGFLTDIGVAATPETLQSAEFRKYMIDNIVALEYVFGLESEVEDSDIVVTPTHCRATQGCIGIDAVTGHVSHYVNHFSNPTLPTVTKYQAEKKALMIATKRGVDFSENGVYKSSIEINPGFRRNKSSSRFQFAWSRKDPATDVKLPYHVSFSILSSGEIQSYTEQIVPLFVGQKPKLSQAEAEDLALEYLKSKTQDTENINLEDWDVRKKLTRLEIVSVPYKSFGGRKTLAWSIEIAQIRNLPRGTPRVECVVDAKTGKIIHSQLRGRMPPPPKAKTKAPVAPAKDQ